MVAPLSKHAILSLSLPYWANISPTMGQQQVRVVGLRDVHGTSCGPWVT